MHPITRRLPLAAAATLAALAALPAAARAQQRLDPVRVTAAAADGARADSLQHAADAYEIGELRQFARVARMYEEAASLRADGDAKRYAALRRAADLRYGAGDLRRATENMAEAAREAQARGDVVNAVRAYGDAAHLAAGLRRRDGAATFTRAAQLLTESPLLSAAQRVELRAALPGVAAVAVLGGV